MIINKYHYLSFLISSVAQTRAAGEDAAWTGCPCADHRTRLLHDWVKNSEKGSAVKTILLADDEANLRILVRITLDDAEYCLLEAADGLTALELARQQRPDLLILDWMMPGLNGIAVAQALRQHPATAHIPIIVLTSKGQETDKAQGHAVGAYAYLVKPFSPLELLHKVQEVLG
jgi:CheY-like chemotaxis protein